MGIVGLREGRGDLDVAGEDKVYVRPSRCGGHPIHVEHDPPAKQGAKRGAKRREEGC